MKKLIVFRVLIPLAFALGGSIWAASEILGFPSLLSLLLLVTAAYVNSLGGAFDDDLPDGFNTTGGTRALNATKTAARVARWALALALVAFGMASLAVGLNTGGRSNIPYVVGVSLACLLTSVALLTKQRWVLWAAALSGLSGAAGTAFLR